MDYFQESDDEILSFSNSESSDESLEEDELNEQLLDAVTTNDYDIIKKAIKNGADINCVDEENGMTPLHYAIYLGYVDVAILLIESGADINHLTGLNEVEDRGSVQDIPRGLSAIGLLIYQHSDQEDEEGFCDLLNTLLEHQDFSPFLEFTLDEGFWEITDRDRYRPYDIIEQYLVDDNETNQSTILHLAVERNASHIVSILLARLEETLINQSLFNKRVVFGAIKHYINYADQTLLQCFLKCDKYNPNLFYDNKNLLLHFCVQDNNLLHLVRLIAEHPRGKDFDIRNGMGQHILDLPLSDKVNSHIVSFAKEYELKLDVHAEIASEQFLQKIELLEETPELQTFVPQQYFGTSSSSYADYINGQQILNEIIAASGEKIAQDNSALRITALPEKQIIRLAPLPSFDEPRAKFTDPLLPIRNNDELMEKCRKAQALHNNTTTGASSLSSVHARFDNYYEPLLRLYKAGKQYLSYDQQTLDKITRLNKEFKENGKINVGAYQEFVIINYRGFNFDRGRIDKALRYEYLASLYNQDYFCDLVEGNFENSSVAEKIKISNKIIEFTESVLIKRTQTPIKQTWNKGDQEFNYPIHFILQRFSNNKDGTTGENPKRPPAFSDDIWESLVEQMPDLAKKASEYGIPLQKSFIIASSKHPRHPIRYALGKSGLKCYRNMRMDGRARNDGSGNKYRLLGCVLAITFSIEEYIKSCPLDLHQAYAHGYIAPHCRVRNEIEVDFPGFILQESIEKIFPIFLPSFRENSWDPLYKEFYGWSKTGYNKIVEQLKDSKRGDEAHKKVKNKIRAHLINHYEVFILTVMAGILGQKQKKIIYVDEKGFFKPMPNDLQHFHKKLRQSAIEGNKKNYPNKQGTETPEGIFVKNNIVTGKKRKRDINLIEKRPKISIFSPHKAIIMEKNNSLTEGEINNYFFEKEINNFQDISGDGNCFFRAVQVAIGKNQEEHLKLRTDAVNYMHDNRGKFQNTFDVDKRGESFEQYLSRMKNKGEYAEDEIIQAVALMLECQINIIQLSKDQDGNIEESNFVAASIENPKNILKLVRVNNNHYHVLCELPMFEQELHLSSQACTSKFLRH